MVGVMKHTDNFRQPVDDERATLESCDSLILCLGDRRFVVVRHDDPRDLWPMDGGWPKLRQLQPGDEVIYKGQRTQVRAIAVYR